MAKSEQAKQRNAHALILANQTYPEYKEYIAKELFFSEFGVSYKTIQEFPNDWIICGSILDQYKQIGNAVPVKLAEIVATHLYGVLTNAIDNGEGFEHN